MQVEAHRPSHVAVHLGGAVRAPVGHKGGNVRVAAALVTTTAVTAFLISLMSGAGHGPVTVLGAIAVAFLVVSVDLDSA
jgi:hypothetical protein